MSVTCVFEREPDRRNILGYISIFTLGYRALNQTFMSKFATSKMTSSQAMRPVLFAAFSASFAV